MFLYALFCIFLFASWFVQFDPGLSISVIVMEYHIPVILISSVVFGVLLIIMDYFFLRYEYRRQKNNDNFLEYLSCATEKAILRNAILISSVALSVMISKGNYTMLTTVLISIVVVAACVLAHMHFRRKSTSISFFAL